MSDDIYIGCMFCGEDVLLCDDTRPGYVPGYWMICPSCLIKEPNAKLWLSPFENIFEIVESIEINKLQNILEGGSDEAK